MTLLAKDVVFVRNLLEELVGGEQEHPFYIYGDNEGSLYLVNNNVVSARTKHVDLRHKYLVDLTRKGIVEVRHVRSEDNVADINSKNVKVETHQRLSDLMYEGLVVIDS